MFATIAFLLSMATAPATAADDPCATLLAAGPELEGLAVEMAQSCQQDAARERLSFRVVHRPRATIAHPAWAFAEMDRQPELDVELAAIGTRVNPFAGESQADPFEAQ